MTVSELIKESKSMRKGFKIKFLFALILSILILLAYDLAVKSILFTSHIYEIGVSNLSQEKPFFEGNEHLFYSKTEDSVTLEITDNQNELKSEPDTLDTASESKDSSPSMPSLPFEKGFSISLQALPFSISLEAIPTSNTLIPLSSLVQLIHNGLVYPILSTALSIGLLLIGLERATHQKFTVCSLLKPLKRKWHLLAFYYIVATYTILSFGLLALIGISTTHLLASNLIGIVLALLLALIPIYYYFTHIYFAGILIYTKKMKATSALRSSHKMVAKNLKLCAWFVVIYLLQMILSSLLLFIPLLWILPKFAIAYGLLFEHLFAKEILSIEDARA